MIFLQRRACGLVALAESAGKNGLDVYHSGMKNNPKDQPADAPQGAFIPVQQAVFAQQLCKHSRKLRLDAPGIARWLVQVWKFCCDRAGTPTIFVHDLEKQALDLLCRHGGHLGRPFGEPTPHVLAVLLTGAQTPHADADERLMRFVKSGLQFAFERDLLRRNDDGDVWSSPRGWEEICAFTGGAQAPAPVSVAAPTMPESPPVTAVDAPAAKPQTWKQIGLAPALVTMAEQLEKHGGELEAGNLKAVIEKAEGKAPGEGRYPSQILKDCKSHAGWIADWIDTSKRGVIRLNTAPKTETQNKHKFTTKTP
jgi:hypothetical protein